MNVCASRGEPPQSSPCGSFRFVSVCYRVAIAALSQGRNEEHTALKPTFAASPRAFGAMRRLPGDALAPAEVTGPWALRSRGSRASVSGRDDSECGKRGTGSRGEEKKKTTGAQILAPPGGPETGPPMKEATRRGPKQGPPCGPLLGQGRAPRVDLDSSENRTPGRTFAALGSLALSHGLRRRRLYWARVFLASCLVFEAVRFATKRAIMRPTSPNMTRKGSK